MDLSAQVAAAKRLGDLIGAAERVVVFTGAGISTESGIPDFRSPGGVWDKYQPIQFQDFVASEEARRESWRRKFATESLIREALPNRGHRAVAKLVERGLASSVVTQNIDGLHQKSGVPDSRVIELHGNTTYAGCLDCYERYELAPIKAAFEADGTLPVCGACGGMVKTATISFGQPMPEAEMFRAQQESEACGLFLAIGSSLVVHPAASLPYVAHKGGAALVILNRDPTPLDGYADLVLNQEIGEVLGDAVGVN